MKQKLILAMAVALSMAFQAKGGIIELKNANENDRKSGPHSEAPTVDYEYDVLTIKADTTYNNAHVVVKSVNGDIQYTNVINITRQPQTLYMPGSDKHSIEIYCGKNIYYGTLENE